VRQWRGLRFQVVHERRQRGRRAFDLNLHAAGMVKHPAGQSMLMRQAVNEGPEADPLHHATHGDCLSH